MGERLFNLTLVIAAQAVSVMAIMAPVGGELYSSFAFDVVSSEGGNILVVTNNGRFQVTGVVLSGIVPGAQQYEGAVGCAEGHQVVVENGGVYSQFDRMTPGMPCYLAIVKNASVDLSGIAITADGFTGTWTIERAETWPKIEAVFTSGWGFMVIGMIGAQIFLLYVTYNVATGFIGVIMQSYWSDREKKMRRPCATGKMIRYVQEEYGVPLSIGEGAILVLLVCGKDTLEQLEKYTGMRRTHIRHLIKKLRHRRLLDPTNIVPIPSIVLSLNAGDMCNDVRPKYGP